MINEVRIDGRIGKDGEVRFTNSGQGVVKFSIAVTERKKQGDDWVDGDTNWYDVEYWLKDGENGNMFSKGKYICLKGRLKTDKWDKDGVKHTKIKIAMTEVVSWEFVKASNSTISTPPSQAKTVYAQPVANRAHEDDIPF